MYIAVKHGAADHRDLVIIITHEVPDRNYLNHLERGICFHQYHSQEAAVFLFVKYFSRLPGACLLTGKAKWVRASSYALHLLVIVASPIRYITLLYSTLCEDS